MLTVLGVAYPLAPVGSAAGGGAEQVLAAIDAALVRQGHRSLVVACAGSRVAGTLLALPDMPASIDEAARVRAQAACRKGIMEALRRFPVDLVHLHGIDFAAYVPDGAVPTLVTLHLPISWYPRAALFLDHPNLRLNCVSAAQQSDCPKGMALRPHIPNGVAVPQLEPVRKGRFCMMLGRICPEKGYHLGLLAAHLAGAPAALCGPVHGYDAHRRYFEGEIIPRLDRERRWLGPVAGARKWCLLAAARCLLVPSLVPETSSLVAMEALACGTPVIAFPVGALGEIVAHGHTGFLVRTVEEMAEAIRHIDVISPERCRAEARRRFSAEAMTGRYLRLYEELGAARERPAMIRSEA
jgi:glycosyltransferase involved in cell wall biosynthesis